MQRRRARPGARRARRGRAAALGRAGSTVSEKEKQLNCDSTALRDEYNDNRDDHCVESTCGHRSSPMISSSLLRRGPAEPQIAPGPDRPFQKKKVNGIVDLQRLRPVVLKRLSNGIALG